jgi:P4 family phage/plasmid primase-like protien
MPKKPKKGLDLDLIKQAARGRWPEILTATCNIPSSSLDGRHHPCPKCGGADRFRLINEDAGAVLCNGCFSSKNGDGIAAIMWANKLDFIAAAREVADYLGIEATTSKRSPRRPKPDKYLEFPDRTQEQFNRLVGLWCQGKPGITPAAIQAAGGRLAQFRLRYPVVALPVWGSKLDEVEPVGWVVSSLGRSGLPRFDQDGKVTEMVTRPILTPGSNPGIIGDLMRLREAEVVWKVEGVSDVLSWLSLSDTPDDHAAVTNANGCSERPPQWVCRLFAGKKGLVLHDADKPGQDGALGQGGKRNPGWAPAIADEADECRNVLLPYPVAETKGKDLRDWILEGGTFPQLRELAEKADVITPAEETFNEKPDDSVRLARVNLARQKTGGGGVVFWHDNPMSYESAWRIETERSLKSKLWQGILAEFERMYREEVTEYEEARASGQEDLKEPVRRPVSNNLVNNVYTATHAFGRLPRDTELDTWLPTGERRNYLSMSNGILDVDAAMEGKEDLLPHSSDWFSMTRFRYAWNPAADCPLWRKFLEYNLEGDIQRINLLQEWAGYLLLPDCTRHKFMMLIGEGSNGKSVYLAGIRAILGEANCSYVPLERFDDKFVLSNTLGRLANISADAGEIDKAAEGTIKNFVTGQPELFDRKYLPAIQATPTARLMIACNTKPNFRDRTDGIWRRLFPMPWNVKIEPEEKIEGMDDPSWWQKRGEVQGMFNWALAGLARLREYGFTVSDAVEDELEEYRLEVNPARSFLIDHLEECEDASYGIRLDALHELYVQYTKVKRPLGLAQFAKEVRSVFPNADVKRTTIGGKKIRVFEKIAPQEGIFSPEDSSRLFVF